MNTSPDTFSGNHPEQDAVSKFLLEEYRNIATTHDNLRQVGTKIVHFGLLLLAFPWTLFALTLNAVNFKFQEPPVFLSLTLLVVGSGACVLTFSLLDTRLGQYRYARTVNLIRKYYADRATEITEYLYLPTSGEFPRTDNLGYVSYLLAFFLLLGSCYVGYGIFGFLDGDNAYSKYIGGLVAVLIFCLCRFLHGKQKNNLKHYCPVKVVIEGRNPPF